jgi:hypothetical protein
MDVDRYRIQFMKVLRDDLNGRSGLLASVAKRAGCDVELDKYQQLTVIRDMRAERWIVFRRRRVAITMEGRRVLRQFERMYRV